jgi:hypothetical protein
MTDVEENFGTRIYNRQRKMFEIFGETDGIRRLYDS